MTEPAIAHVRRLALAYAPIAVLVLFILASSRGGPDSGFAVMGFVCIAGPVALAASAVLGVVAFVRFRRTREHRENRAVAALLLILHGACVLSAMGIIGICFLVTTAWQEFIPFPFLAAIFLDCLLYLKASLVSHVVYVTYGLLSLAPLAVLIVSVINLLGD